MTHFHVHIERDDNLGIQRTVGALTLSRDAGLHEAQVEMNSMSNGVPLLRKAHIDPCNRDCFDVRGRSPA